MKGCSMKRNLLICFAIYLFAATSVWAQTGTSSVVGTIIDPQGKPVPAAKVTLTNVATNAKRTVETTAGGAYLFALINPGGYPVGGQAQGVSTTGVGNRGGRTGETNPSP